MPSTSAVPGNPLTIVNPPSPVGHITPPTRFILFSEGWLELQNYVQLALEIPLTTADFSKTYGDFPASDRKLIHDAVGALKDVRKLAATFGDPNMLKASIQREAGYLHTSKPPKEIYAHIVWLAYKIHTASLRFTFTLQNLHMIVGPSAGTPQQRAENLKMVLTGPGGLVSTADDMKTETAALLSKLASFHADITEANAVLARYAGEGSALLARTRSMIGTAISQIVNDLMPAAQHAHRKWLDYTISAVTTSVGLAVVSFGLLLPISIALGTGLGAAATRYRAEYVLLLDKIAAAEQEIWKKTRLATDLTGFNERMNLVAPAMTSFKRSLEQVRDVWAGMAATLSSIVKNHGVDELSSLPWILQAMKIADATEQWREIGTTAQQFTQNALVSYDFSTRFGQRFPELPAA